jgi:hypothetical protein
MRRKRQQGGGSNLPMAIAFFWAVAPVASVHAQLFIRARS